MCGTWRSQRPWVLRGGEPRGVAVEATCSSLNHEGGEPVPIGAPGQERTGTKAVRRRFTPHVEGEGVVQGAWPRWCGGT